MLEVIAEELKAIKRELEEIKAMLVREVEPEEWELEIIKKRTKEETVSEKELFGALNV